MQKYQKIEIESKEGNLIRIYLEDNNQYIIVLIDEPTGDYKLEGLFTKKETIDLLKKINESEELIDLENKLKELKETKGEPVNE